MSSIITYRLPLTYEQYQSLEYFGRRVCVDKIPVTATIDSLLETFNQFGLILELTYIQSDKMALISYSMVSEATRAIELAGFLPSPGSAPTTTIQINPAKDLPVLVFSNLAEGITVAHVRAWLDKNIGMAAIWRVGPIYKNQCSINLIIHHIALRLYKSINAGKNGFTAALGEQATVSWKKVTWNKLVGVSAAVTKKQILDSVAEDIRESIFAIVHRGYSMYIYYSSEQMYMKANWIYREGLRVNVGNDNFKTFKLVSLEHD